MTKHTGQLARVGIRVELFLGLFLALFLGLFPYPGPLGYGNNYSDAKIPFVAGALGLPHAVESDLVAHRLELVEGSVLGAFGVQAGKEVCAGVVIEGSLAAHVPDRCEH
jgi:hypothetical protein